MVDRDARREYAELVRQLISGRMTNVEYEERYEEFRYDPKDKAIRGINSELWFVYDDILTHRMTGSYRLSREGWRTAAKAVLFLQSDQEYEWRKPLWNGSVFLITVFCVLLLFALLPETPLPIRFASSVPLIAAWQCYEQWQRKRKQAVVVGDIEAWPFLSQADLAGAVRHPRLLNGKTTMP